VALDGKITYINLTSGQIQTETISPDLRKQFLGGRGIDIRLLNDRLKANIDPLSPDNVITVSAGMLAGTLASTSSRTHIAAKSPLTGYLGGANLGGFFAPELRRAGIDHLVISGKAKQPVFIFIDSGKISIRDASFIWGRTAPDTQELIRKSLEDDDVQTICIGPAGENRVRFASVMTRHQGASGRGGLGAVFGSKNLKAVTVRGHGGIAIAHPEEAIAYDQEIIERILSGEFGQKMKSFGVTALDGPDGKFSDEAIGMDGCFGCQLHCRWRYAIRKGNYAGAYGQGLGYHTRLVWENILGRDNIEAVLIANYLVNCYALDALETANLIDWIMRLADEGILTNEETGGLDLRPGNTEAVYRLIESIALHKGLGALLADGGAVAAGKIGKGSTVYLSEIKGVADIFNSRNLTPWQALGVVTATRSSDHLRFLADSDPCRLPQPVLNQLINKPIPHASELTTECWDYTSAPWLTFWTEKVGMAADMLGICDFHTVLYSPESPGFEEFARMIVLNTGMEITPAQIWEAAERSLTLEKLFNLHQGYSSANDRLDNWYPGNKEYGESLDKAKYEIMLGDYYQLHGWDTAGVPKIETLKRLGLGA
jgi:aldehyde:ferredoxin oxidoreductase